MSLQYINKKIINGKKVVLDLACGHRLVRPASKAVGKRANCTEPDCWFDHYGVDVRVLQSKITFYETQLDEMRKRLTVMLAAPTTERIS